MSLYDSGIRCLLRIVGIPAADSFDYHYLVRHGRGDGWMGFAEPRELGSSLRHLAVIKFDS